MIHKQCQRLAFYLPVAWVALLSIAGCGSPAAPVADLARPVKTMVLTAGDGIHARSFPGRARAAKRVELAFQVPGVLAKFPVKAGQHVAKGDMIGQLRQDEFQSRLATLKAELDRARALLRALQMGERAEERARREAQVRAAEARLENARIDFDRHARLLASRAISQAAYDISATNYRVAQEEYQSAAQLAEKGTVGREEDIAAQEAAVRGLESRVVEANLQLSDSTLLAPYDGVIAERFVEAQQSLTANQPVVKFQDVDEIEIEVDVPETVMIADIRRADIVRMVAEFSAAPGVQFPVHVREIGQTADPTTQTFQVRVAMQAPESVQILPGMTATVAVEYRRADVLGEPLLAPISAIYRTPAGQQVAWIVGPDLIVSERKIEVGRARGSDVEIVKGLNPGDRIAVAGVTFLREGMKVRDLGNALGGVGNN